VWHKQGVSRHRRQRPPYDRAALDEAALRYVARFATSRAKLADYLSRKLRERGWAGDGDAPIAEIVEKLATIGYIDDAQYALAKAHAQASRGYGEQRTRQALRHAGIDEVESAGAMKFARSERFESALRYARRRRIGPFSEGHAERATIDKWIAAMVRAGHPFALARRIASAPPGSTIEDDDPAD
jgi:regulatory protein